VDPKALSSNPQRIPLAVPLAEMDGEGVEKLNALALSDVGEVEISPLLLALNEKAFKVSGPPPSLPPPQYTLPFQYAGVPQTPAAAPGISSTISQVFRKRFASASRPA